MLIRTHLHQSLCVATVLACLLPQLALAQEKTSAEPTGELTSQLKVASSLDPRVNAKDKVENDPSVGQQLTLDQVIKQKHYARNQFFRGIFFGEYFKEGLQGIFRARYKKLYRRTPELFDRLFLHADRYLPQIENSPAMVNANFEFEGISRRDYGYCWGFATLIRNMNVLAFYDPQAVAVDEQGRELRPDLDRDAWVEHYEDLIDDIVIFGRATVIPGFKNFRELSLVPEFELFLKLKTMQLWRAHAIRPSGLGTLLRSRKDLTEHGAWYQVDLIEERISRGEFPKLLISGAVKAKGLFKISLTQHVVLAYRVSRESDGSAKLYVWDVNFYAETLLKEPKVIHVMPDGEMRYEPWREVGAENEDETALLARVELTPENDAETVEHVLELERFCSDDTTKEYCQ